MSIEITYARIETEISDYRSGVKTKEQDIYGKLSKNIVENKIDIELITSRGVINCTSLIGGDDKLDLTTILNDGSGIVMSRTRALNTDYRESVSKRALPENGIYVDAVQVEIDDRTMSLKIIKEEKSGEVLAIVKEVHFAITEGEYLAFK